MKVLLLLALAASSCFANEWPQWRGPHRNGISDEKGWSSQWPAAGPKVAWKAEVGTGFSSFSTSGNLVCTTGNKDNTDTVFCFDAASGKQVWSYSYPADLGDKYFEGGTSGTPTFDGDQVFQLSRWGDIICLNAASGKVVWSKNIQKETNLRIPDWGFSGSVLVQGNSLILNMGSAGLALDKKNGALLWKSEDKDAGYSTPLPFKHGADSLVLVSSGKTYAAVNAKTGAKVWEFEWGTRYGVNAADPIISGDTLFISSGYNKGCALVKFGETKPIWQSKEMKNQLALSVLLDGHLYGFDGDSTASRAPFKCIELATGALKWEEKTITPGALMVADGKLIILTGKGELIIAKPSTAKFDVISRAQVLTGKCWSAPVLSNGRIFCRNSTGSVVCLDVRGK